MRKSKRKLFNKALEILRTCGISPQISFSELLDYISSKSYEEDLLDDKIFSIEELVVHEIVEAWELKKKGHKIYRGVILDLGPSEIYPAHLRALEIELEISLKRGKKNWISKRIIDMRSYLTDPLLPEELKEEVCKMIERWERALQ